MTTVTTEQLQKDFASVRELIDRGETIALEENGVHLGMFHAVPAELRPAPGKKRVLGSLAGKMKVPDDFDEMMKDEIEEMFYGKS